MLDEYASLSRETYRQRPDQTTSLPENWKIIRTISLNGIWGNCYVIFMNNIKKEIVLSVRGTDNAFNVLADVGLALARIQDVPFLPPGQEELDKLTNEILNSSLIKKQNYMFTIIGHSLGGVMAELSAVKFGVKCISFESPGSLNIMRHFPEVFAPDNFQLVTSYLSAPNIINTLNSHPGTIYRMHLPHSTGINGWHITECLLNTVFTGSSYLSFNAMPALCGYTTATTNFAMKIAKKSFLSALFSKFGSVLMNLRDDISWLEKQHSIVNIANFLLNNKLGIKKTVISKMTSWPTILDKLNSHNLLLSVIKIKDVNPLLQKVNKSATSSALASFAKNFIPLQKDQPGIRNIFDEDGMREAEIKKIPGYQEVPDANKSRGIFNGAFKCKLF